MGYDTRFCRGGHDCDIASTCVYIPIESDEKLTTTFISSSYPSQSSTQCPFVRACDQRAAVSGSAGHTSERSWKVIHAARQRPGCISTTLIMCLPKMKVEHSRLYWPSSRWSHDRQRHSRSSSQGHGQSTNLEHLRGLGGRLVRHTARVMTFQCPQAAPEHRFHSLVTKVKASEPR